MKGFLKMMLASICALIIVSIFMFLLSLGMVGSLASSSSKKTVVLPSEGVLVMDMTKFALAEQSIESNPLAGLSAGGEIVDIVGLLDAIEAINIAAEDPIVKYIYIKSDRSTAAISQCEELRAALENFRARSGKAIVSYIESPSTGSYYLASVADKVYMTKHLGASTMFMGVSSQMIFLGDLLDQLGVNVQLIRHGKYKSAGEMFVRNSSSRENREQNQRMVDSIWETMSAQIAASRGISVAELNEAIDQLKLVDAQDFVDCGLVDELFSRDEMEQKLADLAVKEDFKELQLIAFEDYVLARKSVRIAANEIAVIYADGEIVDGRAKQQVAGDRFASIIAQVRRNPAVKAVVLRVNSPGGSVLASEKIKAQLDSLQNEKPLIASYGGYAASGGYWISCNCDKVYTDQTTLTGSIGVFSMIPDFSKVAAKKLHIGIESVSSNKHGDMYSLMRPFDSAELAYMQKSIENVYDKFTAIVAKGREMPVERVDALGQGRVWTGADAVTFGLADEIGGLQDAIAYAATLVEDDYYVTAYPKPQTQLEMLMEMIGESSDPIEAVKAWRSTPAVSTDLGAKFMSFYKDLCSLNEPKVMARIDREIVIK